MHGSSRRALSELRDRLTDLANAAGPDLASDLRAVAELVAAEAGLRRALTEPSRPVPARQNLAEQLLGSRIGTQALELVKAAVGARWNSPADLATGLELLAVHAELLDAQRAGTLTEVEDELFRFGRLVGAYPQLATALADSSVPTQRRATLIADLLDGKANASTVRLVNMALTGLGGRTFDAALNQLVELAAAARDRQVAYVTTAGPLSSEHEARLANRLSSIYGREVAVLTDVDPNLLGGVTIRIGNDLYDGSVARRLELAKGALTKK